MSESIFDVLKSDAKKASYKLVAMKSSDLLKNSIITLIEKKTDSDTAKSFARFLDTEMGLSFINVLMGVIIESVPQIKNNSNARKLGEEFRVNGMSIAGNAAVEKIFSDLIPEIMETMSLVDPKVRVLPESNKLIDSGFEEEKEVVNIKKGNKV